MRFGERLEASKDVDTFDNEMKTSVLGYGDLKERIQMCVEYWNEQKSATDSEDGRSLPESDIDGDVFWPALKREIQKIDNFYDTRFSSLKERTQTLTRSPPNEVEHDDAVDFEPLKADITSLQKWVELNHIALVKIHKKYVKNAYQTLGEDFSKNLPVLFQRPFFEEDNELSKLKHWVEKYSSMLLAKTRCSLCKGTLPCSAADCMGVKETVTAACYEQVPGWKDSPGDGNSLIIRVLTGGLSNRLFTVDNVAIEDTTVGKQCKDRTPSRVIARIFGSGEHVDRTLEAKVITRLAELNIGPQTYGTFPNGRLEEFVHGLCLRHYHLTRPKVLRQVSRQVADIHRIEIPDIPHSPLLFPTLKKYHGLAVQVGFTDADVQHIPGEAQPKQKAMLLERLGDLTRFEGEIRWMETELAAMEAKNGRASKVCFTHGDIQEGNLLVDDPKCNDPQVTVIDYEYARYDFASFDIANFFCETYIDNFFPEYPFYRCYPQLLVEDEAQKEFIRSYLSSCRGSAVSEDEVLAFHQEVTLMMLGSHLQWGLWAVLQASESDIEFCYLSYAEARLGEYYRIKGEILQKKEK